MKQIILITPGGVPCRLHPRYRAIHPPRSLQPGCTCREIYVNAHAKQKL
jgi:hypothetical protein